MKNTKKILIVAILIFILFVAIINQYNINKLKQNLASPSPSLSQSQLQLQSHKIEKFDSNNANGSTKIPTFASSCQATLEDDNFHISVPCYNIKEIDNFLTNDECDRIIALTANRLEPSRVYTADTDMHDTTNRKSDQAWLKNDSDPLVKKIAQMVADYSEMPIENQEDLQVVHYEPGGFFKPHYDACEGKKDFCDRMDGLSGPRIWTYIIYLNDDFEGGETYFPYLNRHVVPKKGKCVVFQSSDENGKLIRQSLHGGEPVTKGIKWICNRWIRINKYVPQ